MDTTDTTPIIPKPVKQKRFAGFRKSLTDFFASLYNINSFIIRFFKEAFLPPYEFKEIIRQCYETGVRSFTLISLTGFIVGLIFTKQSRPSLAEFGATSWLPSLVSIAIMRALAPLVTALIAAGKVGSSIGAELGSMRVTEQIDAMEVSGANPLQYLVVTRILAVTFMVPLLTIIGDVIGLIGGYIALNFTDNISYVLYFHKCVAAIDFSDFLPAFVKTIFFGFAIGFVGCYKGFNSNKGTASVGIAANSAVVTASLWVFVIDAIAVQITSILFYK